MSTRKKAVSATHSQSARDEMDQARVNSTPISRDGDDMIIRIPGVYALGGTPSTSRVSSKGKNGGFVLAASPGRLTWFKSIEGTPGYHPSGHKLGYKLTVMLSGKPVDATETKSEEGGDTLARPTFE